MVLALPPSSSTGRVGNVSSSINARNALFASQLAAGLTVAGVGIAGGNLLHSRLRQPRSTLPASRPRLNHCVVDAICGACGEVAGLVALYPLDTVKVQIQARCVPASQVLSELMAMGPHCAARALYAGMGSAALGAAAIGSLYLLTFYAAKRAGTSLARCSSPGAADAESSPVVASAAGAAASIVGSLIEAPIEAFKVRAQAGAIPSGSLLQSMASLVAAQGIAPLYASFLPYLLKAIPHDVAELFTFSQISDTLNSADASTKCPPALSALSSLSPSTRDMVVGAASGAAAAVVSMPFDVIFTRMSLGAATATSAGGGSLRAFFLTATDIVVAGRGPQALFAGVVPRLLQTVPAGIVYWASVQATRRLLEEKFDVERPEEGALPTAATPAAAEPVAVLTPAFTPALA